MCFTGVNDISEAYITSDSDSGEACITGVHNKARSINIFELHWFVRHDLSDLIDTSCFTDIIETGHAYFGNPSNIRKFK